jgi:hypothetical protein
MYVSSYSAALSGLLLSAACFTGPALSEGLLEADATHLATYETSKVMGALISAEAKPQKEIVTTEDTKQTIFFRDMGFDDYTVVTDFASRKLSPPPQGYFYARIDAGLVKVTSQTMLITEFVY